MSLVEQGGRLEDADEPFHSHLHDHSGDEAGHSESENEGGEEETESDEEGHTDDEHHDTEGGNEHTHLLSRTVSARLETVPERDHDELMSLSSCYRILNQVDSHALGLVMGLSNTFMTGKQLVEDVVSYLHPESGKRKRKRPHMGAYATVLSRLIVDTITPFIVEYDTKFVNRIDEARHTMGQCIAEASKAKSELGSVGIVKREENHPQKGDRDPAQPQAEGENSATDEEQGEEGGLTGGAGGSATLLSEDEVTDSQQQDEAALASHTQELLQQMQVAAHDFCTELIENKLPAMLSDLGHVSRAVVRTINWARNASAGEYKEAAKRLTRKAGRDAARARKKADDKLVKDEQRELLGLVRQSMATKLEEHRRQYIKGRTVDDIMVEEDKHFLQYACKYKITVRCLRRLNTHLQTFMDSMTLFLSNLSLLIADLQELRKDQHDTQGSKAEDHAMDETIKQIDAQLSATAVLYTQTKIPALTDRMLGGISTELGGENVVDDLVAQRCTAFVDREHYREKLRELEGDDVHGVKTTCQNTARILRNHDKLQEAEETWQRLNEQLNMKFDHVESLRKKMLNHHVNATMRMLRDMNEAVGSNIRGEAAPEPEPSTEGLDSADATADPAAAAATEGSGDNNADDGVDDDVDDSADDSADDGADEAKDGAPEETTSAGNGDSIHQMEVPPASKSDTISAATTALPVVEGDLLNMDAGEPAAEDPTAST